MSKIASLRSSWLKTLETSRRRGKGDEEKEDGEEIIGVLSTLNSMTLTRALSDFMATNDWKRLLVQFVPVSQTLMALRSTSKAWKTIAEEVIDPLVRSRELFVHDEKNTVLVAKAPNQVIFNPSECYSYKSTRLPLRRQPRRC